MTDEDPAEIAARKTAEQRFHPPLDIVDGAARIVAPIIMGINYRHAHVGTILEGFSADRLVDRTGAVGGDQIERREWIRAKIPTGTRISR